MPAAKAKSNPKTDAKAHPVFKSQSGSVHLAMWANTHEVDGETRVFHTIQLERNYMDKDEQWQKTSQLRGERDLGDAIVVLQAAQQHLARAEAA